MMRVLKCHYDGTLYANTSQGGTIPQFPGYKPANLASSSVDFFEEPVSLG